MTPTTTVETRTPIRINWKINEINLGNVLTIGVLMVSIAVGYGSLTSRVSSNEAQIAGLNTAVKDTNIAIQNLATVLTVTKTLVDERTQRAEARQQYDASANRAEIRRAENLQRTQAADNKAAIERNRAAIASKADKKAKSLLSIIGVK